METVRANGIEVAYQRLGAGPPIVFDVERPAEFNRAVREFCSA